MSTKIALLAISLILAVETLSACKGSDNDEHAEGQHAKSEQEGITATSAAHEGGHDDSQAHDGHGVHDIGHGHHMDTDLTEADNYKVSFSSDGPIRADETIHLTMEVSNPEGNPVDEFEINHEKLMHLIVVRDDLSYFDHIHPDYEENGKFMVTTEFPAGGKYKLFADFVPKGGAGVTVSEWIEVAGEDRKPLPITADDPLVKQVNGKEVELILSNTLSNEEAVLAFHIRDAATKQGIQDLELYLGATGHVVILSEDAEQYLHVHPLDEKGTGPRAEFATSFPSSGTYKIWGQFQHKGEVFTVPFVVEVQ